jgi:hypothetical protein
MTHVGYQLKATIDVREDWLRSQDLPMDTLMDDPQRQAFIKSVRTAYESSGFQKEKQAEDLRDAKIQAEKKPQDFLRGRKRSRWNCELQRRCGTHQFWQVISFSGRFDTEMLEAMVADEKDNESSTRVSQPGDCEAADSGVSEHAPDAKKDIRRAAAMARADWRRGQALVQRRARMNGGSNETMYRSDYKILARMDDDTLRRKANKLTIEAGQGYIRYKTGQSMYLWGDQVGRTRRVLDNFACISPDELDMTELV